MASSSNDFDHYELPSTASSSGVGGNDRNSTTSAWRRCTNASSSASSLSSSSTVWNDADIAISVFKAVPMAVVMIAAVLGNLLVIVAVVRNDRLRLLANTFLVSLAVADLLVAVLVMPFSAVMELLGGRWPFHKLVCDVFNANDVMFSTASLLHLGCVSVDRYVAITDPFGYDRRMTRRRVAVMLGALWTVSAALAHLPIHLGWYLRDDPVGGPSTLAAAVTVTGGPYSTEPDDETWCADATVAAPSGSSDEVCEFKVNWRYGVVSCAISFWLPAIIMVIAYLRIYRAAQRQAKFIQSLSLSIDISTERLDCSASTIAVSAGNGNGTTTPGHRPSVGAVAHQQRQERRKMRREHKAAKTLGVILGAFLCCWLPFFVWYLSSSLCGERCPEPHPVVVSVLFWIGYFNSALNPLIYAAFNRDFRHSFRRTIGSMVPSFCRRACRCCCCASDDDVNGLNNFTTTTTTTMSSTSSTRLASRCWMLLCPTRRICCCVVVDGEGRTPGSNGNGVGRIYGGRRAASEADCMMGDDGKAGGGGVAWRGSYPGIPGRRMVQSITEETTFR